MHHHHLWSSESTFMTKLKKVEREKGVTGNEKEGIITTILHLRACPADAGGEEQD